MDAREGCRGSVDKLELPCPNNPTLLLLQLMDKQHLVLPLKVVANNTRYHRVPLRIDAALIDYDQRRKERHVKNKVPRERKVRAQAKTATYTCEQRTTHTHANKGGVG